MTDSSEDVTAPRGTLSIVAPVYNETGNTLLEFVRRVDAAMTPTRYSWTIIFVDDGSRNDAWQTIEQVANRDPRITGISFARNFGQHVAIAAGLDNAESDYVVVMDSDLQDRPEVIPDLLSKAAEGYDVVFVLRAQRPESAVYRVLAYCYYHILNFLSGVHYERRQGNFSIISRRVVEIVRGMREPARFYGGLVHWTGFRRTTITARHGERHAGRSAYNFYGRLRLAFRIIIGFSTRLLSLGIFVGLLMALISFSYAVWIVLDALALHPGRPVIGWPSVMTAVFFVGGVTNVVLGVLGLYVASLVEGARQRPMYVVGNRTDYRP